MMAACLVQSLQRRYQNGDRSRRDSGPLGSRLHLYNGIYLPLDVEITSRLPPSTSHPSRSTVSSTVDPSLLLFRLLAIPHLALGHPRFKATFPSLVPVISICPSVIPVRAITITWPQMAHHTQWFFEAFAAARCYVPPLDWKGDPSSSFSESLSADWNGWWKEGRKAKRPRSPVSIRENCRPSPMQTASVRRLRRRVHATADLSTLERRRRRRHVARRPEVVRTLYCVKGRRMKRQRLCADGFLSNERR